MCDYSLQHVASRPAKVGDKLVTKDFGTGTKGFADANCPDAGAVCVLPGTELAFSDSARVYTSFSESAGLGTVAIFRQVQKQHLHVHHDALEFPGAEDGLQTVMLTFLNSGQYATVLQLPATPKTEEEAVEQRRVAFAG